MSDATRSIPRWTVPIVWGVGLPLVHMVVPWALSLLGARHGWLNGCPGAWHLLSLLPLTAGLVCALWTMALHFSRISQRVVLESTPRYLLMQGPYRLVRNPMYLGELVLWLGWALFYGSAPVFAGFVLFAAGLNFRVVPREERALAARFGDAYLLYKQTVPRWGVPRQQR